MLNKIFSFRQQSINYQREISGGIINFLASAYIIVLNPMILHSGGHAFPLAPSITATLIAIIIMTILASFLIKLPFILAPGLGINAIVSYTLVLHDKLPIVTVLGVIFWSSLIMFILSITPLRKIIIDAIPKQLQISLSIGIGLFLIFIGLKNANILISNPNTLISMNLLDKEIGLCFFGFILATLLFIRQKFYAMILPIIIVTLLSSLLGNTKLPKEILSLPDFSLFLQVDFWSSLKLSVIPAILSLFIVNFFDATSSVIGLLEQIEFENKEDKEFYYKRALASDGIGGIISGLAGTAPSVIFIESSAGIQLGAKTGFASIISAILFIPFLFLAPLISIIPDSATSPILILVCARPQRRLIKTRTLASNSDKSKGFKT